MPGDVLEMDNLRDEDREAEADEPLINRDEDGNDAHEGHAPEQHGQAQTPLHKAGKVVWLLTLSAGISGLLFGYDTGVISSTLVSIGTDLSHRELTTTDKSVITAITSFFALLSAPCTGYLADRYGRRSVILIANILFILGAVVQAASGYVWLMVVGRAAVGAAVGLASCATPLYITELAPAEMRGRLVVIQSLFITGGQVVAYLIGWTFANVPAGWRWMVGLGAVPAVVQIYLLRLMFETPRWLLRAGREERAYEVLRKIYGGLDENVRRHTVESVVVDIQTEIAEESKLTDDELETAPSQAPFMATIKHLFYIPGNRRALTIACMLQGIQQLCGFNSLMYFSATIFKIMGFDNPIATSLFVALTNFVFTIAAFAFIDALGRRKILLYSIPIMVLALGTCSWVFTHLSGLLSGGEQQHTRDNSPAESAWPVRLLIAMIVYVAAYAIGLGCVPWQQSELFPLRVRSLGSGIATATNWSSNFVIGITFLPMMEFLSPSVTFAVYAIICLLGWIAIWMIYPETAGLQLEGIGELLKDGWGVKKSLDAFKERKKAQAASRHDQGASSESWRLFRWRHNNG
jgi:MFS transporter, SP family, solute carrier family 2 (myo-inositol transporter), member 13